MSDMDPFPAPPGGPEGPDSPIEGPPERRRSTAAIWIGLALVLALLVVAAVALTASDPDPAPIGSPTSTPSSEGSPSVEADVTVTIDGPALSEPIPDGEPIPAWSAPTLGGALFEWVARPEGPTVLAVWAPWCPHCQAELPRLAAAIERHPGVSLVTIATALGRPGPTPQEYMESEGLTFTVGIDDEASTLAAGLGVRGFPTTYFVDASGRVIVSAAGELDPDALDEVLTFLEGE